MANALFQKARQAFLKGDLDWEAQTFKALLLDTQYTVDLANHDFLNDIATAARIGTGVTLAGCTALADGIADANDVTFASVASTYNQVARIVIYRDNAGTEASSEVVVYMDTATGMPVQPNGGDLVIQWENTGNYIFKL